jgi:hypothetical protein
VNISVHTASFSPEVQGRKCTRCYCL